MIVLFSSDEQAQKIIEALNKSDLNVSALVSEKAKPTGRGLKLVDNPAVGFAKEKNIKTLTPDKLDLEFQKELSTIINTQNIEIGLVFSYGKIIPQTIIDSFKFGILNIHPSLLPLYRGATPIQSALLAGDDTLGLSIIKISAGCDCGDILYQEKTDVSPEDDYSTLKRRILGRAVEVLPMIIKDFISGKIKPVAQDESKATQTIKFSKSDGEITDKDSAPSAFNKIRAFSVWPKAYFILDGKRVIAHKAKLQEDKLEITLIQVEGKSPVKFVDFKRGYPGLLTLLPDFVSIG